MIDAGEAGTGEFSALHVLVIDDQEHVRRWIARVLRGMGVVQIAEAEDGASALARVTAPGAHFDFILSDLRMPNTDGVELIRKFAELRLDTAVVLISMEPERVLETAGMLAEEQGLRVIGTLAKPVTVEKLEPLFRSAMPPGAGDSAAELKAAANAAVPHRNTIRDALTDGVLSLLYQPQIVMATGRLAGVEALARWRHPQFGLVSPDVFVSCCEESTVLGEWLLDFTVREAMLFASRWSESGEALNVAINVHAGAFDQIDLPDRMEDLAKACSVPTGHITFELTERSVAHDAIRMLDVSTRLRLKGFGLAIDDFGTGHSGLSQLRRLPFNQLKIDRQFVHGSADSPSKRSVVEASVSLARNLQMTSVAEGIQRRTEWDLLQSLGCEEMQGFFTARPMTEEGLQAWTAQWSLNQFAPTLAV